ncbi:oxysterol-binding protein-related protein 1B-like [Raphanus sativus]|uniref:Oxysterol-binding protein-related protein 1B-like n=1 Tax=Raphanus sativus TaxID=3726 RepID=A0A6J0MUL7_RAPSA|nr:oxysterol-binding protein-related protein 1B-like [Raphanus sativus]XP_056854593.1 oxysterol-binding protein-related protein 1B-like [Raphanus sativus]
MEAKVISCTTFGNDKVVKIVVWRHRSVANYKPEENETTVVVADDTCSEKDVEEIEKTCEKLDYVYEGRLHVDYDQTNIGPGLV